MKTLLLIPICSLALTISLNAQFQQVTQGAGYANQVYYDIATNTSTTITHEDWDIAFGVSGFSSSVVVNEGVISSQSDPAQQIELYASSATDFTTADTSQITERIHNNEVSWEAGAFNHVAIPGDPFDLGWGSYNPATQTVNGSRVFFLLGRDGVYRKLMIESLISGVYTFRHALLDGSEEMMVTVDKTAFIGKNMAYYSFNDGVVDLEPTDWDLLFTRYTTPLPDDEGNILQYTVTGVLHNIGIGVAELSGVDPETTETPLSKDEYDETLNVIGFDWKSFDLSTFSWSIPEDLVYFVRNEEDQVWRIQ
ncbi:MAG: HmuY family protein, partial [Bacteroidota bacterium]